MRVISLMLHELIMVWCFQIYNKNIMVFLQVYTNIFEYTLSKVNLNLLFENYSQAYSVQVNN